MAKKPTVEELQAVLDSTENLMVMSGPEGLHTISESEVKDLETRLKELQDTVECVVDSNKPETGKEPHMMFRALSKALKASREVTP